MSRRRSKPPVQRYHDRVARQYDASYEDAFWQWHDALTWDALKPFLPAAHAAPALDLGCGTGKWALRLLDSGYAVTCVDVSGSMVQQARRKIEGAGRAGRAAFLQADLRDLSALPDAAFDLALALGDPIGCTEAPARALKQVRRKLRPTGVLVASLDNRLAAIDHYLAAGDLDALETFLRTGRTHWLTRDPDERFPIWTYTPAQAVKLFEQCGFEVLDVVGKTVLPLRHARELLADASRRRRLTRLETRLSREPAAIGRAAHLQIAARRPPAPGAESDRPGDAARRHGGHWRTAPPGV
jgi:SAM-dependent methyltransferase